MPIPEMEQGASAMGKVQGTWARYMGKVQLPVRLVRAFTALGALQRYRAQIHSAMLCFAT